MRKHLIFPVAVTLMMVALLPTPVLAYISCENDITYAPNATPRRAVGAAGRHRFLYSDSTDVHWSVWLEPECVFLYSVGSGPACGVHGDVHFPGV